MPLLDAIEADSGERERLIPVLQRRIAYLAARAEYVSRRESDQPTADVWRNKMVAATLWIEAFESAACLGAYPAARQYLRQASTLLLQLNLPFGLAVQRALLPYDDDLRLQADVVRDRWQTGFDVGSDDASGEARAEDDTDPVSAVPRARDSAQQWAYLRLSDAATPGTAGDGDERRAARMPQFSDQTPVGRMQQPMHTYASVGAFRDAARQNRPGEPNGMSAGLISVLRKNITAVLRAVQWSRANTYLWRRMLAPAPLFDLDSAVLTGTVIEATRETDPELVERAARIDAPNKDQPYTSEDQRYTNEDQRYVNEFVRAVRALRSVR